MKTQQSARRLLKRWLMASRGRAALLSRDVGVTRQAVSSWSRGVTRPMPHLRELIEAATDGVVPAARWGLTPAEKAAMERLAALSPPEAAQ